MVLKGQQKNQTVKNTYTVVVYLNEEHGNYEVSRHMVKAESVKEAVRLVNDYINNR